MHACVNMPAERPQPRFLSGQHIVVAGAGMAGLSFALALRKLWAETVAEKATTTTTTAAPPPPRITMLERDTARDAAGRQGYSISLAGHDETGGLAALRDLGLLDAVLAHAITGRDGAGRFKVWDEDWAELLSVRFRPAKGLPTAGIRIARAHLRQVLVATALWPHAEADEWSSDDSEVQIQIRWGVACTAAEWLESGRVAVRTTTTTTAPAATEEAPDSATTTLTTVECDLLVVADGANSKLRRSLRPDDRLRYAGAVQMGGLARFPSGAPPPLDRNWGMQISRGQGVSCFYSPVDEDSVVWALSFLEPAPRPRLSPSPSASSSRREFSSQHQQQQQQQQQQVDQQQDQQQAAARALLEEARARGSMLGPLFHQILDATTPTLSRSATEDAGGVFCFPAMDKQPFRHDTAPTDPPPRIIFIGDSNHAVSPFAGYGASLALKDGWDLARQLVAAATATAEAGSALREAVRRYDDLSVPRAAGVLATSRSRIRNFHSTGLYHYLVRAVLAISWYLLWLLGET